MKYDKLVRMTRYLTLQLHHQTPAFRGRGAPPGREKPQPAFLAYGRNPWPTRAAFMQHHQHTGLALIPPSQPWKANEEHQHHTMTPAPAPQGSLWYGPHETLCTPPWSWQGFSHITPTITSGSVCDEVPKSGRLREATEAGFHASRCRGGLGAEDGTCTHQAFVGCFRVG